ncbi:MAG TPA: pirin family protein [Flavisolibacter sp.]|nr:pirin family protein [Flavisolibacter sp.]
MQTLLFPAKDRGVKDIGWLQSNFFFSFSDYYHPSKSAFGTLFAFNDDYVQAGKGFGIHPHINMEIISVMLKGSMNHKDSMGYSNVVHEDWVQIMSAGSGLFHEEYNVGETDVNFLQIWILPKQQNIRPRYQWRQFPRDKRRNRLQTIISGEEGMEHCWINQNTKIQLGLYDEAQTIHYAFNAVNKCLFLFVIEGSAEINNNKLGRRDAIGIWDTSSVDIDVEAGTEFLLIETPVNQK